MFNEIIAAKGTSVVRIADVKKEFPEMVGHVMRSAARVQRGVYDLSKSAKAVKKVAKAIANAVEIVPNIDNNVVSLNTTTKLESEAMAIKSVVVAESLIPEVDPTFVPHGCYQPVLKVIKSNVFAPVYITGNSGNGKTFGVEQACAKAGRELIIINITNETCEEDLIGSYVLEDGNMIWKDGPVIVAMRRGAVLCLDEIDQARASILALQTIAQGKSYFIKKTNELVKAQPGFALIATANTKGNGDGMDRFVGAQILNEAFLERFNIVVEQPYPTQVIEKRILSMHTEDNDMVDRLVRFAGITRRAMDQGAISHCITTRRLVQIVQNVEIFGKESEAVQFAINRFDADTRDSFMELYEKIQGDESLGNDDEA